MENHPIPQDITGFQFKLIGNMTVKQFIYLALGCILGWLFFIFPLPGIIKLPLTLLSVGLGASFAFIPVDGRPLDVMVGNFIKAFFAPTQYVYAPEENKPEMPLEPKTQSGKLSEVITKASQGRDQGKDTVFFDAPNQFQQKKEPVEPAPASPYAFANTSPQVQSVQTMQQAPTSSVQKEKELEKEEKVLEEEIAEAKVVASKPTVDAPVSEAAKKKVELLQQELDTIMEQKKLLEQQLTELSKQLSEHKEVFTASTAEIPGPQEVMQQTQNVRKIPAGGEKSAGLPATPEAPNIVTGIVKDPRGNSLPNILVEVKDGDGNPVRAFKTNGLGHFASATPLVNGTYTIEFEDPKGENKFDKVSFNAGGEIILPLEATSSDTREELRKELFN